MEVEAARRAKVLRVGVLGAGPKHQRSDLIANQARAFSGFGVPHAQIALLCGISSEVLVKYYRDALDEGEAQAHAAVARSLYQQAVSGNSFKATAFYLRCKVGWSERERLVPPGLPPDAGLMSVEQREAVLATLRARLRHEERAKLIEGEVSAAAVVVGRVVDVVAD